MVKPIVVIELHLFWGLHELTQSGSNLKNHNLCDLSFPVVFRAIQAVWTKIARFRLAYQLFLIQGTW
jgi:hypothetical protein